MTEIVRIADLLARLGERIPFGKAADWDPVGLQLGDAHAPVERVAVCHEVTERIVAELEQAPVDLLISYHPLLFRRVNRLLAGPGAEGRAFRLVRAGVSLAVVHTAFDVAQGGTSDALAEALGLVDLRGFAPLAGSPSTKIVTFLPESAADSVLDAVALAGAGRIGNYTHCSYRTEGVGTFFAGAGTEPAAGRQGTLNREPEVRLEFIAPHGLQDSVVSAMLTAHPYEEPAFDVFERQGDAGLLGRIGALEDPLPLGEFAATVHQALEHPSLRVAGDPDRLVRRVAVVPGSGEDFLDQAAQLGADTMVTGDLSHHRVQAALERGLCVIDAGHIPTERPGLQALFLLAAACSPECRSLLEFDPDPWGARE